MEARRSPGGERESNEGPNENKPESAQAADSPEFARRIRVGPTLEPEVTSNRPEAGHEEPIRCGRAIFGLIRQASRPVLRHETPRSE